MIRSCFGSFFWSFYAFHSRKIVVSCNPTILMYGRGKNDKAATGRLVNLAAGDGHPAEIMDMSFAIQALSAKYLVEHGSELTEKLIDVPVEVDKDVAKRKLAFLGKEIDVLTPEQEKYLNSYSL